MTALIDSLAAPAPPPALAPALQALWWLAKGQFRTGPAWERAHAICQDCEGDPACDRVHALAHLIEGDRGNAAYWYRRAGSAPAGASPEEDWALQVADL
ncbi:MAG: hypothetical protein U1E34_05790 [Amaricoccus sp.]